MLTVIMSGRKRKNYEPNDPRNWPKERYIERLKTMGIGINSSWKVEFLRQSHVLQTPSENHQDPIVPAVTTAASSTLDCQRPFVTSAAAEGFSSSGSESRRNSTTDLQNVSNEALLRETMSALRSATETLSSISKIMLKQANTAEIDKSGYTLASTVKAMNADEDSQEVNTTDVDLQQQVMNA